MANPYDASNQPSFGAGYPPGGGFTHGYAQAQNPQSLIDDEHLRLLRIGYFISAGQTAIFIPFGLVYAVMGVVIAKFPGGGPPAPPFMSWFFGIFGAVFAGLAAVAALLKLITAIRLKERRSRVLCLVTAGFSCLEIPYGTALGLMTFIVLARPNVKQQFDRNH